MATSSKIIKALWKTLQGNKKTAKFAETGDQADLVKVSKNWADDPEIINIASAFRQEVPLQKNPFFMSWYSPMPISGNGVVPTYYHGTPQGGFSVFSNATLGSTTGAPSASKAHFFTSSPSNAATYAKMQSNFSLQDEDILSKTVLDALGNTKLTDVLNRYIPVKEYENAVGSPWRLKPTPVHMQDWSSLIDDYTFLIKSPDFTLRNVARGLARKYNPDLYDYLSPNYASSAGDKLYYSTENYSKILGDIAASKVFEKHGGEHLLQNSSFDALNEALHQYKQTETLYNKLKNSRNPSIYKVFLREPDPFVIDYNNGKRYISFNDALTFAGDAGHSGAVFKNVKDPLLSDMHAIFDPRDIKSVFNNTFDINSSNITKSIFPYGIGLGGASLLDLYNASRVGNGDNK